MPKTVPQATCFLLLGWSGILLGQQPVLTPQGALNAASLAPPGLPNAPIGRGSVFSVFGESLGPAAGQTVSAFPLLPVFSEVSLSVTQNGVSVAAIPIYVSATQINAIMPSGAKSGLASLRLTYQTRRSNAIPIEVADSAPGIFALSSGGYGPGIVQNFIAADNQPINSLRAPAVQGQVVTIWATGLGPVAFPDTVAPTAGDVAATVTVTIGGRPASKLYSGRSPCCSGVDQVLVKVPDDAPLGCWVPVQIRAGSLVSNTVTMAIAGPGDAACTDAGNPLSTLVRTPGSQAFIHVSRGSTIHTVYQPAPTTDTADSIYARFYNRPDSAFAFDPYLSYPPAGTCLVHQTVGDSYYEKNLRGALPPSASLSPQPALRYDNGGSLADLFGNGSPFYATTLGGSLGGKLVFSSLATTNAKITIDAGGPNEATLASPGVAAPVWPQRSSLEIIPRNAPLNLSFTPGDAALPTAILLYAYAAVSNSTVEVQCLAAPGASSFTVPADTLANLPLTYRLLDGSYNTLLVGTLGLGKTLRFSNGLAASGLLLNSSWLGQSVVLQ